MSKFNVLCTLPNASEEISGVAFKPHAKSGGMITVEPVETEVAAMFKGIPGYVIADEKKKPTAASDSAPAPAPTADAAPETTPGDGAGEDPKE